MRAPNKRIGYMDFDFSCDTCAWKHECEDFQAGTYNAFTEEVTNHLCGRYEQMHYDIDGKELGARPYYGRGAQISKMRAKANEKWTEKQLRSARII